MADSFINRLIFRFPSLDFHVGRYFHSKIALESRVQLQSFEAFPLCCPSLLGVEPPQTLGGTIFHLPLGRIEK
jgi:hypothetical protein